MERLIIPMLLDLMLIKDFSNVLICLISFLVVSECFNRRGRRGHREIMERVMFSLLPDLMLIKDFFNKYNV